MSANNNKFTIGLDYGTNSVRAVIVDTDNGREVAASVWNYATGTHGVILSRDPNLARQHPADYVTGAGMADKESPGAGEKSGARVQARTRSSASGSIRPAARRCRWIATAIRSHSIAGSPRTRRRWPGYGRTTPALPRRGRLPRWRASIRPQYLAKCGGTYSSEWFFSKILHCLRTSPEVFEARLLVGRMRGLDSRDAHRAPRRRKS